MRNFPSDWDVDPSPPQSVAKKEYLKKSYETIRIEMYRLRVGDRFTISTKITPQRLGLIAYWTVAVWPELAPRKFRVINDGYTIERIV